METETDYFIQSSRLKSSRRRKRSQKLDIDKRLIRLYKEERALSKQIWNLGYDELKPPVQRGWKRFFVLREDVARTKEANFFDKILEKINTTQYSSRKDFKVRRRKLGKKFYAEKPQELERLCVYWFDKKKFNEKEKSYFSETRAHLPTDKRPVKVYVFNEPWRFVLRIQPNIITKVKRRDINLESRKREIEQYLESRNLRDRQRKLMHGSVQWHGRYDWEGELKKYRDPYGNKSFSEFLTDHWPEHTMLQIKNPRINRGFCFLLPILFNKHHTSFAAESYDTLDITLRNNILNLYQQQLNFAFHFVFIFSLNFKIWQMSILIS